MVTGCRNLVLAALAASGLLTISNAWAHAVCGDRVFPATLVMDDPGVGDELSLPTIGLTPIPSRDGGGRTMTYGYEWDKTITQHLGFSINGDYLTQSSGGTDLRGFDNITIGLKDEILCSDQHEFMASVGVSRTFAGTGSPALATAGAIDTTSSTSPTLYLGKGLGDLPIGWLRPLAVTGEFSYQISDRPGTAPSAWNYAASVQYSIPYLQSEVKYLGLPSVLANLTPLVEVSFSTPANGPAGGRTIGTISPGILYDGDTWQFGVEAMLPANGATRRAQGIGIITQVHFFLDDIFPHSLGKPLF